MDATFIRPDVQRAIEFPIQLLTMGLEWWALSHHCMACYSCQETPWSGGP